MAPKKDTAKKEIASKQGDLREEKMKALESALAQLNKTYGKGAVMKFGDAAADANRQVIPTGCLELDMALGVGGLPRGRVVEIYGPESSGKTTVALHCVAEAQKMGGVCAFSEAEKEAALPLYRCLKPLWYTRVEALKDAGSDEASIQRCLDEMEQAQTRSIDFRSVMES